MGLRNLHLHRMMQEVHLQTVAFAVAAVVVVALAAAAGSCCQFLSGENVL